jgi:excisionase family DNA binding protein
VTAGKLVADFEADPLLSRDDVARVLGVSRQAVEKAARRGGMPGWMNVRLGGRGERGRWVIRRSDFDSWLESRKVSA